MTKNLLSSSFHPKRFSVSLALLIFAVILHIFTSAVAAKFEVASPEDYSRIDRAIALLLAPADVQSHVTHRFIPSIQTPPSSMVADVEIRWKPPVASIDVDNYTVYYRFSPVDKTEKKEKPKFKSAVVPGNQTFLEIRGQSIDDVFEYQLQVSTYEKVLNRTESFFGACSKQNPVPKYLVVSPRTVHLYDKLKHKFEIIFSSDEGSQTEATEVTKISSISYIAFKNELFWIDQNRNPKPSIVQFSMASKTKVGDLVWVSEDADLLTVDWVQQVLYWVEIRSRKIIMFDLVRATNETDPNTYFTAQVFPTKEFALDIDEKIVSLVVDPWISGLLTFISEKPDRSRSIHQVEVYGIRYSVKMESGHMTNLVDRQAFKLYPLLDPDFNDEYSLSEKYDDETALETFGCKVDQVQKCHALLGNRLGPTLLVNSLALINERLVVTAESSGSESGADFKFVRMSFDGCSCQEVEIMNNPDVPHGTIPPFASIISATADSKGVTWMTKRASQNFLSCEHVNSIDGAGEVLTSQELPLPPVQPQKEFTDIVAFGHDLQPVPPEKCLIPRNYSVSPTLLAMTYNSINLGFKPDFVPSRIEDPSCVHTKMPTVVFSIFFKEVDSLAQIETCGPTSEHAMVKCNVSYDVDLIGKNKTILNLKAVTTYVFQIGVTNYFSYQYPSLSPPVYFRTSIGPPSGVESFHVYRVNPYEIMLTFMNPRQLNGPSNDLQFYIGWRSSDNYPKDLKHVIFQPEYSRGKKTYSVTLKDLQPATLYKVAISVYHALHEDLISPPKTKTIKTFDLPKKLLLENVNESTIEMSWTFSRQHDFESAIVSIYDIDGEKNELVESTTEENLLMRRGEKVKFTFSELKFYNMYKVMLTVIYKTEMLVTQTKSNATANSYQDDTLILRTLPGNPEAPNKPELHRNRRILRVLLESRRLNCPKNSSLIFEVQACKVSTETEPLRESCSQIYKGNRSTIDLQIGKDITIGIFLRARVRTDFGVSHFSPSVNSSFAYLLPDDSAPDIKSSELKVFGLAMTSQTALLMCAFSGFVILIFVFISCRNWCVISSFKNKRISEVTSPNTIQLNTLNRARLSLLQEAPFKAENDILYYVGTNYTGSKKFDSLQGLKMIKANYIQIDNLIGSGAFGEVYSALSRLREGSIANTRIAVKFLNNNAGPEQKQDFIQEAILMRNFEHPNIVEVYGICMDSEPIGIIMELMQNDLLTFLRQSRNEDEDEFDEHSNCSSREPLSLKDQIMFAIDIANGCNYLSEHHMLHRDLAARNCLVSKIADPALKEARANCDYIVKVGDFGLARDVYKQEYYRKTGNALMPVRWMSPESLIDGIFTSQSDVWSYGVVFWEIMTFGNQPYPGKDNVDVLHFVKSGGRLEPPESCIPELGQMMENCWNKKPSKRPTFFDILNFLDSFLRLLYFNQQNDGTTNEEQTENDPGFYSPIYVTPSGMNVNSSQLNETQESLLPTIRTESPQIMNDGSIPKWDYPCSTGSNKTDTNTIYANSLGNYSTLAKRDGLTDDISSLLSIAMSSSAISQNESCNDDDFSRSYMRVCNQLRVDDTASPFPEQFSDSVAGAFSCNSVYLSDAEFGFQDDHHGYCTARKTLTASTPMERKHKPEASNSLNSSDAKSYQNMEDSPLLSRHSPHPKPNSNYVIKNGYAMLPNINRKLNSFKKNAISDPSKPLPLPPKPTNQDAFFDSSPDFDNLRLDTDLDPVKSFPE